MSAGSIALRPLGAAAPAFEPKLRAEAPVRGEVLGDLPVDGANGLEQIGIGDRPARHVDHRDNHASAPSG
jgi:hypothetical protein